MGLSVPWLDVFRRRAGDTRTGGQASSGQEASIPSDTTAATEAHLSALVQGGDVGVWPRTDADECLQFGLINADMVLDRS